MKTELQERGDILVSNLQRSVDTCFEILRSISQLFASSTHVSRLDFHRFVSPALSRHPSIYALEWLPRLTECDRLQFEQAVQREGFTDFHLTEQDAEGTMVQAGHRREYCPVYYAEPLVGNQLALGYDLASDPIRRAALERARDSGAIALSGRIELVQHRQYGFLVVLPIYQGGGVPPTPMVRQECLQGFVLGVFRIADVVNAALAGLNLQHTDFYLSETDPDEDGLLTVYLAGQSQLLADAHQLKGHAAKLAHLSFKPNTCRRSFTVADRQWVLMLAPTSEYVDRIELYKRSELRANTATAEAEKLKLVLHNLQQTQARWLFEKKLIAVGVGMVLLILGGANLAMYRRAVQLAHSTHEAQQRHARSTILSDMLAAIAPATTAPRVGESELSPPGVDMTALTPILTAQLAQLRQVEPMGRTDDIAPIAQALAQFSTTAHPQRLATLQQAILARQQMERSPLQIQDYQATQQIQLSLWITLSSIGLSTALLVGVYYLLQRQMTERQQVESALFEANSQLAIEVEERLAELEKTREISDLKMRLFSMVSHEFRTPLSTILVSSQLLSASVQQWSDEKKTKNLARIQAAAKTMAQLLGDILTLNRAEAGKLEFHPEVIDLVAFCRRLIDEIQSSLDHPRTILWQCDRLSGAAGDPPPLSAYVDGKLLHSILTNLLSNALKYSPGDRPVTLRLQQTDIAVQFQVEDQGIGIAGEDLPHLYDTFYRGTNVGNVVGSGVGLAVVKTCVDLHGGQIAFHSTPGQGTMVTVTLPQV